jgi:hypothetical protein
MLTTAMTAGALKLQGTAGHSGRLYLFPFFDIDLNDTISLPLFFFFSPFFIHVP